MAEITTKKRDAVSAQSFALPAQRKYPLPDANHVRNATARLEQAKKSGTVSDSDYRKARAAITRAAKRFGIESEYLQKAGGSVIQTKRRGLHMHLGLSPSGDHRIEIMHAADADGIRVLLDALELSDEATTALRANDGPAPVWIQLAKVGSFRGHSAGPFELSPATFSEIERNFRATANKRIPIDFEHASEEDSASGSIPQEGAPAQGWILDLDNRGDGGLWGLVEWLEPARGYIREGKYRYFSPAIRFGSKDRVTGKPIGARMTSGALTNSPFLDGMLPVAAKDAEGAAHALTLDKPLMSSGEFMPRVRIALGLHPLASAADCTDKLDQLREYCGMADHPGSTVMGVQLGDYLNPLKRMMCMSENTTVEQLLDAVEEMIDAAIAEHVAIDHSGESNMDADMNDKELAVQLGETKGALRTLTEQHKTLETEHARATLTLKDVESKLVAMTERATSAEAVNVTLREQITKREEVELEAAVSVAFETYRDVKKLGDADRKGMLLVAKTDPKLFGELYPPVNPGQQHLLRNLTSSRATVDGQASGGAGSRFALSAGGVQVRGGKSVDAPTRFAASELSPGEMIELTDRLKKSGMTAERASSEAFAIAKGLRPMPQHLQS